MPSSKFLFYHLRGIKLYSNHLRFFRIERAKMIISNQLKQYKEKWSLLRKIENHIRGGKNLLANF